MKLTPLHTPNSGQGRSAWLNEKDKRILKYAAYTGGVLIIGGATYLTIHHYYKKSKANKAQTQSLNDNSPENFAKRLKMAFDNDGWWGTNVDEVRKVFTDIPDMATFQKVSDKYEALTEGSKGALYKDLTSELTSSEYYEMQSILKGKPLKPGQKVIINWNWGVAMAHRIKAAFDYTILGVPSTDKPALEAALNQIPSLYAFAMVKVAYKKEYGHEIENDLDNELDAFDFSWKKIIYTKPRN